MVPKNSSIRIIQNDINDVEKIIGIKAIKQFDSTKFEFKEGNLFVYTSMGKCSDAENNGWDIEKGKIISFVFYVDPKNSKKLKKFVDISKLKKIDAKQYKGFLDDDKDILYTTGYKYNGKLESIIVDPYPKYEYLHCPKSKSVFD